MSAAVGVFLVCVVAAAVAHVAILISSVSARASTPPSADMPRPRIIVEFIWALVPILVLALLFTATWDRVREKETHPAETMKVAR